MIVISDIRGGKNMAVVSIIISALGLVLSFILGFPLSLVIGPYIGLPLGLVGLVLAIIARKNQKSNLTLAALIISIIVVGICLVRIFSFASCAGRIAGWIGSAF